MATFASRISDLTNAIATAVNARAGRVGASAYEVAVLNGYTGTQAQWTADMTARMKWRGYWAANTAYAVNDVVYALGGTYVCVTAHTSASTFSTTNWFQMGPEVFGKAIRIFRNATLSVPSQAGTAIPMTSTYFTDGSDWFTLSGNGIKVTRAGLYDIGFWSAVSGISAAGSYGLYLQQNGGSNTVHEVAMYSSTGGLRLAANALLRASADDVFTLNAYNSNGSATFGGNGDQKDCGMSAIYLGQ